MKLFDDGDAAIVTGAGNGIGKAIALALVAEGVPTVFADINPETVETAVKESNASHAFGWVGDLGQRSECERLVTEASAQIGCASMLVHSASPPRHESDNLFTVDEDTWKQMHAVNVDAAFYLCRELSRRMIDENIAGSLLLLTSLHTLTPRNLPHYSSSKGAMDMIVKEFAKSLGQYGIRANALVPGAIAAGGFKADPAMSKYIPLGRLGVAGDLAPMALAVLSNLTGGYVTGTSIVVDGGIALTNWFDAPQFDFGQES